MLFNNWNISGCVKFRMLDNKTSSFDVAGDIPEGWSWQLLYSCNGNLNIVEMQHEENILSVIFTKEMLPTDGTYLFQLKATKGELVKHTNIVKTYVNKSLSGDISWPVIPTEFTQIEQAVKGYAESAKESATNAAASATKAENAVVHSPIIGENGNWFIWDFEKSKYVDSGKPASIGGGADLSLGLTSATVGQTVKVKAVDAEGKPTAWDAVDMAGEEKWEKIAEIELRADTAEYVLADFATWRKVKVMMTRSQYISGLNKNVWCRIANLAGDDRYSCGYMTSGYGYAFWEFSAEVNELFASSSHIETNNQASQTNVTSTGTFYPLRSPVNNYKFMLIFTDTSVIQAGDKVTVIGVRR